MSDWFCDSEEAKEHKRTCKNVWDCHKCVWIDESSNAMAEYGTVVEKPSPPDIDHPLTDYIIEKFGGQVE